MFMLRLHQARVISGIRTQLHRLLFDQKEKTLVLPVKSK